VSQDYYQALQVDPAADAEVIEAAYRRLARKFHPDVSSASDAPIRMRELNEAWSVLRDPARRGEYDRSRVRASVTPPSAPPRAAEPPKARPGTPRSSPPVEPPQRPPRRAPRREPRAPIAGPPPAPTQRSPAAWERIADRLLAHRLIVLGATSGILLTVVAGSAAARLFVADEPPSPAPATPAAVVLVTRAPTPEATATVRPIPSATAAAWPPFLYVPVPVPGAPIEPTATPAVQPGG
jgi:hypothetical protein